MSISSVGSPPPAPVSSKPVSAPPPVNSEKTEGAKPDKDADADNAGAKAPVKSATAPGTGAVVNKSA